MMSNKTIDVRGAETTTDLAKRLILEDLKLFIVKLYKKKIEQT